jgi:hypothetical protein
VRFIACFFGQQHYQNTASKFYHLLLAALSSVVFCGSVSTTVRVAFGMTRQNYKNLPTF